MKMTDEELRSAGFWLGGTVYSDDATIPRVQIDQDARGFIVYIMMVEQEVMKAGKTDAPSSRRMRGTFGSLRNKMGSRADHPRYQEQTFKEHARATILAKKNIDLWAQDFKSMQR